MALSYFDKINLPKYVELLPAGGRHHSHQDKTCQSLMNNQVDISMQV